MFPLLLVTHVPVFSQPQSESPNMLIFSISFSLFLHPAHPPASSFLIHYFLPNLSTYISEQLFLISSSSPPPPPVSSFLTHYFTFPSRQFEVAMYEVASPYPRQAHTSNCKAYRGQKQLDRSFSEFLFDILSLWTSGYFDTFVEAAVQSANSPVRGNARQHGATLTL